MEISTIDERPCSEAKSRHSIVRLVDGRSRMQTSRLLLVRQLTKLCIIQSNTLLKLDRQILRGVLLWI